MPLTLARLRRSLGRSLAVGYAGSRPGDGGSGTQSTVPLTVRGPTADGADVRLLVEVMLAVAPAAPPEPVRIALALLLPASRRWLAGQELALLPQGLPGARDCLEEAVRDEFDELGLRLLRFDIVAVEHLLASPSADGPTGGPP